MFSNDFNIPFFFDNTLNKKFKVFGQVLYIYFDPTFRRYVSVIDVGLKQRSTIFVDEVFKYRKSFLDNNFQFIFSKKKDTFFLKPVHFLNSKNERALKKRYLSFSDRGFSFLKLNQFSFLNVKYFTFKNENWFNFKNEAMLSLLSLKSLHFYRLLKSYKIYALIFLNFLKNLKHKFYKTLTTFILLRFLVLNTLNIYKSLLYAYYVQHKVNLSRFLSWFDSFKNKILTIFVYHFSDLNLKKLPLNESNSFFKFKSEKSLTHHFDFLKNSSKLKKLKKRKVISKSKRINYFLKNQNRLYLRGLNENSNLFNLSKFNFDRLNKLEFSFKPYSFKFNTSRFNFLNSHFDSRPVALNKKLRTPNYFSVLTRGRAYALVNKFSFFNIFTYSAFLRRKIFKNWLKFLIYYEKLNYLVILNNEEVSLDKRHSLNFFYSLYFPLIFNFRNLFFNLLKFFKSIKAIHENLLFKNLGFWFLKKKKFNKRFFGILLNFLLLSSKKFNKIPKNRLLNLSSVYYKSNFKGSNLSTFNNLGLIKYMFLGFFNIFLENVNYLYTNLKLNEKFINNSLAKLLFINFSLSFNTLVYNRNHLSLNTNIEDSKSYLNTAWIPVFKIFKSLRIVSKYAKKYRRRANFSKRKKFKSNFKKRGHFLAPIGTSFRFQKLFIYPFKVRSLNTQDWSASIRRVRVSPTLSRYGAYLNRLNALSRKFKSKVRLFPLRVFKNRLSMNFDKSKYSSSSNIYYQRFLTNLLPKTSRIKRSLNIIKMDRFIRKWDKNQFFANPVNKNIKRKFIKEKFKNREFNKYSFNRKNSYNRAFTHKSVSFNSSKRPFYKNRSTKRFY